MSAHNGVTKVLNAVGREMVSRGMNDRAIADELGCSSSLVAHWRTRNNIKSPAFPVSAKLNTIGIEMYNEGCSDTDIAKAVGCSIPNVRYWRALRDLPAICKAGSEEWYARRDCTTRSETILAVERGLTDREAAKELGISRSAFTLRRNRLGIPPGRYERKPKR